MLWQLIFIKGTCEVGEKSSQEPNNVKSPFLAVPGPLKGLEVVKPGIPDLWTPAFLLLPDGKDEPPDLFLLSLLLPAPASFLFQLDISDPRAPFPLHDCWLEDTGLTHWPSLTHMHRALFPTDYLLPWVPIRAASGLCIQNGQNYLNPHQVLLTRAIFPGTPWAPESLSSAFLAQPQALAYKPAPTPLLVHLYQLLHVALWLLGSLLENRMHFILQPCWTHFPTELRKRTLSRSRNPDLVFLDSHTTVPYRLCLGEMNMEIMGFPFWKHYLFLLLTLCLLWQLSTPIRELGLG